MESDTKKDILFAINGKIPGAQNTTVEIFQTDKWIQSSVVMPAMVNLFCVAFQDSRTILIAGGALNDTYNLKTYFLSLETLTWSEGPNVFQPMSYSHCGRLITSRVPIIE